MVGLLNGLMSDRESGEALARDLIGLFERGAEQMNWKDRNEWRRIEETGREGADPGRVWFKEGTDWVVRDVPALPGSDRQADADEDALQLAKTWGGAAGGDLKTLWRRATHHGLDDHGPGDSHGHVGLENFRPDELQRLNRLLLSALFPGALKTPGDPSTGRVAYADQRFRFAVLLTAGGAFLFLLFGWVDFNRHNPSYEFYRNGIARHFLGPAALSAAAAKPDENPAAAEPDPPLHELEPWRAGLPFPLFAGTMTVRRGRVARGGTGRGGGAHALERPAAEHAQFVLSPLHCGGPAVGYEETATYAGGTLRTADAVTIPGSAVSPFFNDHPWLGWFMTAFNLRLGVWLPRPGNPEDQRRPFDPWAERDRRDGARGAWGRRLLRWFPHAASRVARGGAREVSESWRGGCGTEPANLPRRLPAAGAWPVLREHLRSGGRAHKNNFDLAFAADGGFRDNLGVEPLLQRRCRLIVASDAGYNQGSSEFTALGRLVRLAREEHGVEFLDLDADRPLDLDRFSKSESDAGDGDKSGGGAGDDNLAPQQVLALRIRYPERPGEPATDGLLVYLQMALTGREDHDLGRAREDYPNFPDEPTDNQMYSDEQAALYRRLGAHVGGVLCRNLPRAETPQRRERVLGFDDLCERLTLAYLQECGTEGAVADGESSAGRVLGLVGGEAVKLSRADDDAPDDVPEERDHFPTDEQVAGRLGLKPTADAAENADRWLRLYDRDPDFRLYHDRRAWRLMRGGDPPPHVPRDCDGEGGKSGGAFGTAGALCPGHVAVLYLACARRADLDPPRTGDGREKGDHRARRGVDWAPFAAGGRKVLMALIADRFGGSAESDNGLRMFLNPLRHHVRRYGGEDDGRGNRTPPDLREADGHMEPGGFVYLTEGQWQRVRPSEPGGGSPKSYDRELCLPSIRTDFPTPEGVEPVQRFLIAVSESVAPERDAVQIVGDLAVCLHREDRAANRAAEMSEETAAAAAETAGAG